MKDFRFRLQRVLDWRYTELDLEQARLEQQMRELKNLDSERADIEAAGIRSEFEMRAWRPLTGTDLIALAAFRRHVIGKETKPGARKLAGNRRGGKSP